LIIFARGCQKRTRIRDGKISECAIDPFLRLLVHFLKLVKFCSHKTHISRQRFDYFCICMACSTFLNILWLSPSLTTYLSYLLQKKGCIRDYFTCLGEVNTYEEVESCPLSTKLFEKCSKLCTSQFIEMHELFTIESHSRGPILYQ
jgi:hypothetical protein